MILQEIDTLIEEGLTSLYQNHKKKILGLGAIGLGAAGMALAAPGLVSPGMASGAAKGLAAIKTGGAAAMGHLKAGYHTVNTAMQPAISGIKQSGHNLKTSVYNPIKTQITGLATRAAIRAKSAVNTTPQS